MSNDYVFVIPTDILLSQPKTPAWIGGPHVWSGMTLMGSPTVPRDEAHFIQGGKIVAKITDLLPPG